MYHRPFRIHSNHICTCAQFPHIVDGVACVVELQESGQRSKPAKEVSDTFSRVSDRIEISVRGAKLDAIAVECWNMQADFCISPLTALQVVKKNEE